LEARVEGVNVTLLSDTESALAGSPFDLQENLMPEKPVPSQVPEQVLATGTFLILYFKHFY
jgi:hypothetical protein